MKKKILLIYIILFFVVISIPSIGMLWNKTTTSKEKKKLASFPSLIKDGSFNKKVFGEFDDYLADHFAYKEKLVTDIVYEDELVMAFMDMEPINEGHILLVPKEHYLDVDEIPDEILSHLMIISKKIFSRRYARILFR